MLNLINRLLPTKDDKAAVVLMIATAVALLFFI